MSPMIDDAPDYITRYSTFVLHEAASLYAEHTNH